MQTCIVATPVGRRPMTLAVLKRQLEASGIPPGKRADKWRVLRDVCAARVALKLQDRSLAVLNALLSFYPHDELAEEHGLVVFPSNAQLSMRANGLTGTTLRRHVGVLVDAGVILRKDSPNGKRYAHKADSGGIAEAFGFSLAPLLARAEEFAALAQEEAAARARLLKARERLTLCRRDARKLIAAGIEEGAAGDWSSFEAEYKSIATSIPRAPSLDQLDVLLSQMEHLRGRILNCLKIQVNVEKMAANASQSGAHIQITDSDFIHEFEPALEDRLEANSGEMVFPSAKAESDAARLANQPENPPKRVKSAREAPLPLQEPATKPATPLNLVLKACPEIAAYGPEGRINNWRDLMAAAVVVRSTLGVSPSAYEEACEVMGPENAAVTIACILERAGHITSAGGYLRTLTARARRGEFWLDPMLMARLRSHFPGMPRRAHADAGPSVSGKRSDEITEVQQFEPRNRANELRRHPPGV